MHKRYRTTLATVVASAVTGGLMTFAASPAVAEGNGLEGDFNNDGRQDVVASAPFATVGGDEGAGQVVIYWGTDDGISPEHVTPISQDTPGIPGGGERLDNFGWLTSTGDFNDDGYDDIVVGAPGEDVGGDKDGGMVTILWGAEDGVRGTVVEDPDRSAHDFFGSAVTSGDYDADGVDDLAIGADSPVVHILKGGIDSDGEAQEVRALRVPILDGNGVFYMTSGQVDGGGSGDDLIVNGFDERPDGEYHYNANFYFSGQAGSGLTSAGQKLPAGLITGIGDTNGDGYGDLVIGTEWDEIVPGATRGGKVSIRMGTASGPDGDLITVTQNTPGVGGGSETDDRFGAELHLGDVNGDGYADLVVGAHAENLGDAYDTGMVHVFYGSEDGIVPDGSQTFTQNTPGVPGSNEDQDNWGSDVHLADVDGDGFDDLTVGAYGENNFNGAVTGLESDGSKIVTVGSEWIGAADSGISTAGQPGLGLTFAS